MNPPTILRPVRPEERSWAAQHPLLLHFGLMAAVFSSLWYSDPHVIQKALAGDTRVLQNFVVFGIYLVASVFGAFAIPKARARQKRSLLTITGDELTLKLQSSGVDPEEVLWTIKRGDLREIRTYGTGRQAQFVFFMKSDSVIRRFFQISDPRGGRRFRVGSWVLNSTMDAKANPPYRPGLMAFTSAGSRKAMLDSDLGRALSEHGYLKPDARGKWVVT